MMYRERFRLLLIGCVALVCVACSGGETNTLDQLPEEEEKLLAALIAAEDRRPGDREGLQPLYEGLKSRNRAIQRMAVRGLGRMERADLAPDIAGILTAANAPEVRVAAANALAQSVYRADAQAAAFPLLEALNREQDPEVRDAIVQALGRLPYQNISDISRAEEVLLTVSGESRVETLLGAALGFEALTRLNRDYTLSDRSVARLEQLATLGRAASSDSDAVRVRRLALAALASARRVDTDLVESALNDPDREVRRLAVTAVAVLQDIGKQDRLIQAAFGDKAASVRLEALRVYGMTLQKSTGCGPLLAALDDTDTHVILRSIDLLGAGCAEGESHAPHAARLQDIAERLRESGADWQAPAHALVSLAALSRRPAMALIPRFAAHGTWQVRMYGALAAAITRSIGALEHLAADPHPNVMEAALTGLQRVAGRRADVYYIRALEGDDYQLIRTAAGCLRGSRNPEAPLALISAFQRISAQRRETSRDTRRALLERLAELGDPEQRAALAPYIKDFDPVIAERMAQILTDWTGETYTADPQPMPWTPTPSIAELRELAGLRVIISMESVGEFELKLLPFDAPKNAARFARLAANRYFDGLTFHRVASNFVTQGGSPGANEFMGDGPYTRDELTTRSHLRGTVGISTRGRDTGDGQLFINLVDNIRLDHNYTIFAEVIRGMNVVDRLLEGAVMTQVRMGPATPSDAAQAD